MDTKRCPVCREWKPRKSFHGGGYCPDCRHRKNLEWRTKNPEKAREIRRNTKHKYRLIYYRLTAEQYDAFLEKQDYRCKICKAPENPTRRFSIDHDHVTQEVRGLLCQRCNAGLGSFQDNPYLLIRASLYLKHKL